MKLSAEVLIENATFDEWLIFFESYREKREKFVKNEVIQKLSESSARVDFEVTDLAGLTDLSAESEILDAEKRLGVSTKIL